MPGFQFSNELASMKRRQPVPKVKITQSTEVWIMLRNLMLTLGGVLFGWLVTWFYYKKSGNELARLGRLSTIILNAMEDGGPLKLNRDESGEIRGRVIPLSVTFEGGTQMSGELQVLRAQKNRVEPRLKSTLNRHSLAVLVCRKLWGKLCRS
jgi:hypothetical protein